MKRKQYLLGITLAISMAFLAAGCQSGTVSSGDPAAESAPVPEHNEEHRGRNIQGEVLTAIDPAACESSYREFLGVHYADYQALMQALVDREPQVSVTEELANSLIDHMKSSPYGVLAEEVQVNGGELTILFRFDEEEHQEKRALLDSYFLHLINDHVSAEDNDLEKTLAIYQGLMEMEADGTYFGEAEEVPNVLDALESCTAQSSQYAEMLSFSLQQFGIEAFPMVIRADYPEVVVCARLGDSFFYLDPFYEMMATMGDGLMGFGMTSEDLEGYLNSSQAEAWNAQGEFSPQTLELSFENSFVNFRTATSWSWGENHTLEVTDIGEYTYTFHTDTLEAEGLPEKRADEQSLAEMYPIFDSIVRTMYEENLAYDPDDADFLWGVLERLSCNYGYYFDGVSYEEEGYVQVAGDVMAEMAAFCLNQTTLPAEIPAGCSIERLADGSYRMPLGNMSEDGIRMEDTEETEDGWTARVAFYHPGEEPGDEEMLAEYLLTCIPDTDAAEETSFAFYIQTAVQKK